MKKIKPSICFLFFFALLASTVHADSQWTDLNRNGKQDIYEDNTQPVNLRVEDLLSQMTLKEKIAQLGQVATTHYVVGSTLPSSALQIMFKNLSPGTVESPFIYGKDIAIIMNSIQKYLREETRLGIPGLPIAECLHGHMAAGSTIFPQAIGLSSTWNPDLVNQMGAAIAREASACGVKQALSPVLDLARDPRWGRVEETYGEDPYLVSKIGEAFITGMQGGKRNDGSSLGRESVFCTAKHFVAYGSPESGINLGVVRGGERELHELYLVPFKHAIVNIGVGSVMPSYNEYDGIPLHSHYKLLTQLLKKQWGFDGYIFSDYDAINMLRYFQKVAENKKEAAYKAFKAGVDLEAGNMDTYNFLEELVSEGRISIDEIDQSVRRILSVKFRAGLFEDPFVDTSNIDKVIHTQEHQDLALELARESIVLLENKNILPLSSLKKKIAVIGPNADQVQFGDYSASKRNQDGITILQGIKSIAPANTSITYAKGCDLTDLSKKGFKEAIDLAAQADVAIVVLGGTSATLSGIGWGGGTNEVNTCGEGFDRSELDPPGVQLKLLKEVSKKAKKVVTIIVSGRPYTLAKVQQYSDAIIQAWYPGEKGGQAVAEILFGEVNPSGRLTVSFPRSIGHLPCYYNYKPSAKGFYRQPGSPENPGRDYVFADPSALYSFGYGLSYSKFTYSNLQISSDTITSSDTLKVSLTVTNLSLVAGKETVQLYLRDEISSVTTPVKALKRFKKVAIDPMKKTQVEFELTVEDLKLFNENLDYVAEPGEFTIMIGSSSQDIHLQKSFRLN
ncbi:MAG: glycoside hydrolase family 3 C-terminal domain-containing protein [Spirochaetales bacterium]|nr:glycoside hydrolase family 3 C-terminal domain-containing protein [Spirochaetales bacterium]